MSTPTHTPTPWHVATNPGGPGDQPAFPSIRDSSGQLHGADIVAMPLGESDTVKANAEFIVRSVNAHAELVAMLERVHEYLAMRNLGERAKLLEHEARAVLARHTEASK